MRGALTLPSETKTMSATHRVLFTASLVLVPLAAGCDSASGSGSLTLLLEPEASITDGVAAGSANEDIVDGWSATFSKYVVAVGDVRLDHGSSSAESLHPTVHVVDLTALPSAGFTIVDEPSLAAGRWDRVDYALVSPTSAAVRHTSVSQADLDTMVTGGCTYLIEGTLSKSGGQSCPPSGSCRPTDSIDFEFCVPATVTFTDCGPEDGLPGLVITSDRTTVAALTFHGDHLFFSSFPAGEELVARRAQWLADADTDGDDLVTRAELEGITGATALSTLFPSASYNLANAPGGAIDTAFDFVVGQLRTQGHFQGEGECAFILP